MREAIVPNKSGKGMCRKHNKPSTFLKLRLHRGKTVDRKRICDICREEWIIETVKKAKNE